MPGRKIKEVRMMTEISQLAYRSIFLIPELTNQYLLTFLQQSYSLQKKHFVTKEWEQ